MVSKSKTTLMVVSTIAAAGLLAGCAGTPEPAETGAAEQVTLTFVAYGGVGQEAMIHAFQQPYTAEHPEVTFINTSPPDVAQVKAQVEAGAVLWDVLATSPAAAEQNCGTLFEPLDFSDVDASQLVEFAVGECYIGNFVNATPLAYITDSYPAGEGPKSIKDFFDPSFPGQRGILTNLQNGILEYPLLADGVAPEDLYPLDVDRSLEVLDGIRSMTTFAPNVGALQQAVGGGQVDMFLLSDSRIAPLLAEGVDITVVWDITVTSVNAYAVPKGSPKVATANAFLATVVNAEAQAQIAEALGVQPVNLNSKPVLDENAAQVAVYSDVNTGETVMQDVPWYAENFNEVTTKLTNWLAG